MQKVFDANKRALRSIGNSRKDMLDLCVVSDLHSLRHRIYDSAKASKLFTQKLSTKIYRQVQQQDAVARTEVEYVMKRVSSLAAITAGFAAALLLTSAPVTASEVDIALDPAYPLVSPCNFANGLLL